MRKKNNDKSALGRMCWEELVEEATRRIHMQLLEEGGKGMKSEVHLWMSTAIRWNKENV
jgi:hypothetical protein